MVFIASNVEIKLWKQPLGFKKQLQCSLARGKETPIKIEARLVLGHDDTIRQSRVLIPFYMVRSSVWRVKMG